MIPLYKPPTAPGLKAKVQEVLESNWWGYGPLCSRLEERFVESNGGVAIAMNSCTSALFAAARLLEPKPGDEAIVPAITYASTAMAFQEAGFIVRIADVDPGSLMITPATVQSALTRRTRAVVVVHLYGQRAKIEDLALTCREAGIVMVEDRAHRIGICDPPMGEFACYSFNVLKEAPAGDGGMLWFRDYCYWERARSLSNVGLSTDTWQRTRVSKHGVYTFGGQSGLKLRLNDIAAAFVLAAFDCVEEWETRRRGIHASYNRHCSALSAGFTLRDLLPTDSCLMAVLRVEGGRRDEIRDFMQTAGVATSIHYPPLSQHELFSQQARCPVAESAAESVLTLPLYPDLADYELNQVLEVLAAAAAAFQVAHSDG